MSNIPVCDMTGESLGEVEIPDGLLVLDKGEQAVHDVVVAYRARIRAGTASTKGKGDVAGSNAKPWKQKGLGRARAGYRQSPIWRGGGVVFGPHPRRYTKRVSKKTARLAFRRVFSEKVAEGSILVVKEFQMDEAKTKVFANILKKLNIKGLALIVFEKMDRHIAMASHNIPGVEVAVAKDVHTYQLLRYSNVIVSQPALTVLKNRLNTECN